MKKHIITILSLICIVFMITGCNASLQTNDETVKVEIKGVNADDYSVTFEYDGKEYTVINPELYEQYKNQIGETADAVVKYLDESGVTDKVIELLPEVTDAASCIFKDISDLILK